MLQAFDETGAGGLNAGVCGLYGLLGGGGQVFTNDDVHIGQVVQLRHKLGPFVKVAVRLVAKS